MQRNGMAKQLKLNLWAWDKAREVRKDLLRRFKQSNVPILTSDDSEDPSSILKSLLVGHH